MSESVVESQAWVTETYGALVGTLTLYCGDRSTAEDCAQEALVRLWMRRPGIDDPRAWVFRCAFHLVTSTARRRLAERRAVHRLASLPRLTDEHAAIVERYVDLHRGLAALPVRQRQAVLLRYLADLDIPQVARAMGCSSGTVKAHLARGLAALRSGGLISPDAHHLAGEAL